MLKTLTFYFSHSSLCNFPLPPRAALRGLCKNRWLKYWYLFGFTWLSATNAMLSLLTLTFLQIGWCLLHNEMGPYHKYALLLGVSEKCYKVQITKGFNIFISINDHFPGKLFQIWRGRWNLAPYLFRWFGEWHKPRPDQQHGHRTSNLAIWQVALKKGLNDIFAKNAIKQIRDICGTGSSPALEAVMTVCSLESFTCHSDGACIEMERRWERETMISLFLMVLHQFVKILVLCKNI